MNHLMQVTVIERTRPTSLSRQSEFHATDGQQFTLTDWPEIPESQSGNIRTLGVARRCEVVANFPGYDSPLYKTWTGPLARQAAISWIESQLPF